MLNIYTGNHKYPRKPYEGWGITDHVSFLSEVLNSENLDFKISNFLSPNIHNILIENFDYFDVFEVEALLRSGGTYSIVLTEHMKNSSGIIWDNRPLHLENEYMKSSNLRFFNLMHLIPNAKSLLTIFGVPLLSELKTVIPNSLILNLDLTWDLDQIDLNNNKYDLCFFGKITPYREKLIKTLKEKFKERLFVGEGITKYEREKIILNSNYNLHIPISKNWKQQSPMRIYSAAQLGRKTLFINFDGLNIDNLHSYQLSRFLIEINDMNSITNFLKIKKDKNNSRLENTKEPNKNEDAKKSLNTKIKKQSSISNLINVQKQRNNTKKSVINIYDKKILYQLNPNLITIKVENRGKKLEKNIFSDENHLKEFKRYRDAISYIYRFTFLRLKGKTFKDSLRFFYYDLLIDFLFNRIIKFKLNSFFHSLFIFRPKNRLKKFLMKQEKRQILNFLKSNK